MDVDNPMQEEGVPNSMRIIQDCDCALDSMEVVFQHKGKIVKGLANHNGQRHSKDGSGKHGGIQHTKACAVDTRWLHPLPVI